MNETNKKILYTINMPGGKIKDPAYPGDAGLDVHVAKDCIAPPYVVSKVDLGISIAVPESLAFTFLTRSSAIADNLFVLPSLIDSGYRGPLYLFVLNFNPHPLEIRRGSRIAQIVLLDNHAPIDVEEVGELPASTRGTNGFGSSGGTGK